MTKKCWKNKFVRNGRKINAQRQKSQQHKLCEIIEFVLYPTEPMAPNQTLLFSLGIVGWDEISFSNKMMANDDVVSLLTTFRKRKDSFLKNTPSTWEGSMQINPNCSSQNWGQKQPRGKKIPLTEWLLRMWPCWPQNSALDKRCLGCAHLHQAAQRNKSQDSEMLWTLLKRRGAPVALEAGISTSPITVTEFLQVIS